MTARLRAEAAAAGLTVLLVVEAVLPAQLLRVAAHLFGWHTPECLQTTDPRQGVLRMAHPECLAAPGKVAKIWAPLGWHRWVTPTGRAVR